MAQIDKNTVKADNQLGKNPRITFEYEENSGKRILIVGNSITRHSPKADIGWFGDWGMAASSKDKDYVHLLEKLILPKSPDSTFCICQAADWERNYKCGSSQFDLFALASEFGADIIILRIVENCPHTDFDADVFKKEYLKFISYLNTKKDAKIIIASSFWKHPADSVLKTLADENGYDFIYLGDLGERSEMRADGLYEHSGVAAHPGDLGMENIAKLIFDKVEKYL